MYYATDGRNWFGWNVRVIEKPGNCASFNFLVAEKTMLDQFI